MRDCPPVSTMARTSESASAVRKQSRVSFQNLWRNKVTVWWIYQCWRNLLRVHSVKAFGPVKGHFQYALVYRADLERFILVGRHRSWRGKMGRSLWTLVLVKGLRMGEGY